jgi:threonylcarbamoyladenosine tRNA methylthiotransferase MtaB
MMSRHVSIAFVPQTPLNITQRGKELSPALISASLPTVTRRPTFALYTLGCKVNQYDSHQISRSLVQRGFRRVEFRESADLYVIDTCTVTAEADKKSRKAAGRARRNNAEAIVAITGCAAAYARDQFQRVVPDALVLDNTRKLELPDLAIAALQARPDWNHEYSKLRDEIGSEPLPSATRERAVLKVQDGCNHKCSYCIIPTVRGASVTKTRDTIMSEARAFVREGARELTVTGVSMSDWGLAQNRENHSSRNAALCDLLRSVAKIEGLERVRVSSLDPADVDDEFLHTVASTPKVCPHIHLALQAGSAATLRRMRRRYTPEMFSRAAKRWRDIRPDGGLTTDVIVGFPGETAADFEESLYMAREARFSAIHVFPYSPRASTVAASLPDHVAPAEQKRRVDALLQLARELSTEYVAQFLGQTLPILVETSINGMIEGMTPHYVKARVQMESSTQPVLPGDIVWMRATKWSDDTLHGTWQPRLGRK